MKSLKPIEHQNQRVLTTQQLAEGYGTDSRIVTNNFSRNKGRYILGKHYYRLTGEELKGFLQDRKSVVSGKSVGYSVEPGGGRIIKQTKKKER